MSKGDRRLINELKLREDQSMNNQGVLIDEAVLGEEPHRVAVALIKYVSDATIIRDDDTTYTQHRAVMQPTTSSKLGGGGATIVIGQEWSDETEDC